MTAAPRSLRVHLETPTKAIFWCRYFPALKLWLRCRNATYPQLKEFRNSGRKRRRRQTIYSLFITLPSHALPSLLKSSGGRGRHARLFTQGAVSSRARHLIILNATCHLHVSCPWDGVLMVRIYQRVRWFWLRIAKIRLTKHNFLKLRGQVWAVLHAPCRLSVWWHCKPLS